METDSIIYSKIPFCRCDCYGQLVNQQKYAVTKIVLFGSRARGTNTERSDVDIAIYGGDFDSFYWDVKENIHSLLMFDVVQADTSISDELKKEIEKDGVVIYEKA